MFTYNITYYSGDMIQLVKIVNFLSKKLKIFINGKGIYSHVLDKGYFTPWILMEFCQIQQRLHMTGRN